MNTLKKLLLTLLLLTAVSAFRAYCQEPAQQDAPVEQTVSQDSLQADQLLRERFHGALIALVLVSATCLMIIFFRHQAALRLERAYMDLEEANARAKESSEMKTQFIRQISHEIRTPLNLLAGFAQVLAMPDIDLDDKTRRELKDQISANTGRITGLVNKMLELSDANSKTVIDRNENISVMQIAAEATAISGISTAKHVQLDLQLPDEIDSPITTNRSAAVRALALVLDNARKFTEPAEGQEPGDKKRVTLRVEFDPEQIHFIVEDTGIGIPPEKAEQIFDEFVQLNSFNDGTGIGLSLARSLARRLGGDVRLDSSYTDGARFHITLPS